MSNHIVVVESRADWRAEFPHSAVVTARDYLERGDYGDEPELRVINLCRSYRYSSVGYYCSLLAEARRHKVIPSVRTILDLSSKSIYSLDTPDLDELLQKSAAKSRTLAAEGTFELYIFFGLCSFEPLQDLARQLFETFPAPLLRVELRRQQHWRIESIKPVPISTLNPDQHDCFVQAINGHLSRRWRSPRAKSVSRYDLAILHNPADPMPPSNARALQNFMRSGKRLGFDVDLIEKKDYSRLAEYDALFIRETTRINHHTYRFAKRAESEGMVVIDDPNSILRCTNKIYLAELLKAEKVPTPRTVIVQKSGVDLLERELGYPIVLKIPDGSFSRGVFKANDRAELETIATKLFKESDLILGQEFIYTEFDWRIGILNRKPIYACQYFMSKKHWQIVNHGTGGRFSAGGFKTFPASDAPAAVVKTALKAAKLIGDGLYGVDLKQTGSGVVVIEVNDNPSIDAGVEDAFLKDELYRIVLEEFLRRLDRLFASR